MSELLDAIIRHVPPPTANLDTPFQMMVSIPVFLLKKCLCTCGFVLFGLAGNMF